MQYMGKKTDVRAKRRAVSARRATSVLDFPATRRDQRGEYPDERRLAGAVRPEEADDLAAARRQGRARDGPAAPEVS